MKKTFVLSIIISLSVTFYCYPQIEVLEKSVDDELFNSDVGPNKKNFKHFYFQYSMFPTDYEGAELNFLKSYSYGLGYRYKHKLSRVYSVGLDFNYLQNTYNLKQNDNKVMPNSIQHKDEFLRTNNFSVEAYQRFIIGRTGNMLGLYFDLGGYATYVFSPRHIYKDKISNDEYNSKVSVTKHKKLSYFEPFAFGFRSRFGYNKFGIVAEYRLTELLKNKFNYPKLPEWSVGIQLSVF